MRQVHNYELGAEDVHVFRMGMGQEMGIELAIGIAVGMGLGTRITRPVD